MDAFLKVITAVAFIITAVGLLSGSSTVTCATAGGCVAGTALALWQLRDPKFIVWLILRTTMGGAAGCLAGFVIEICQHL